MKVTPFPMKNLTTIFNKKKKKKKRERKKALKDRFFTCRPVTALMEFLAEQRFGTNCTRTFRSQGMLQVPESEYEMLFILSFMHISLAFLMKKGI